MFRLGRRIRSKELPVFTGWEDAQFAIPEAVELRGRREQPIETADIRVEHCFEVLFDGCDERFVGCGVCHGWGSRVWLALNHGTPIRGMSLRNMLSWVG